MSDESIVKSMRPCRRKVSRMYGQGSGQAHYFSLAGFEVVLSNGMIVFLHRSLMAYDWVATPMEVRQGRFPGAAMGFSLSEKQWAISSILTGRLLTTGYDLDTMLERIYRHAGHIDSEENFDQLAVLLSESHGAPVLRHRVTVRDTTTGWKLLPMEREFVPNFLPKQVRREPW